MLSAIGTRPVTFVRFCVGGDCMLDCLIGMCVIGIGALVVLVALVMVVWAQLYNDAFMWKAKMEHRAFVVAMVGNFIVNYGIAVLFVERYLLA